MSTQNLILVVLALSVAAVSAAIQAGSVRRSFTWMTRRPVARFATVAVMVVGVVAAALAFRRAPDASAQRCDANAHHTPRDGAC